MSSVYVANLSASTDEAALNKFMAFCGAIQRIEMQEGSKAIVTFEKPSAASTALMLNGGTLDGSPIQVSSEVIDEDTPSIAGDHDGHGDVPQEDKPRTAIVAEYLAHGYVLSDSIIQKALSFDQKHGISARFLHFFNQLSEGAKAKGAELENETGIRQKAAGAYAQADEKVKINEKASKAYATGQSYYQRILKSEFGQQAKHFYTQTSNNIKSVHDEASRIAADKKSASNVASGALPGASTSGTSGVTGASAEHPIATTTNTLPPASAAAPGTEAGATSSAAPTEAAAAAPVGGPRLI